MSRVYRCTFMATYADGTLVEPSLHYQSDLPPLGDEPDPDDVASGLYGLLGADYLQTLPPGVTLHDLVCTEQVIAPAIGVQGSHHVGLPGTGTAGAEDLPRELVPILNLRTDTVSRSARGHIFLCSPGDKTKLVARDWQQAYIDAVYAPFAAKLSSSYDLGAVTPTHMHPVIYSRTRHQRSEDPYTFQVVSAALKVRPTWLRSRATTP